MKNAQGVILTGCLYVGGGYTGSPKTDATIHVYDLASGKWTRLPVPGPAKWSGLGVHRDRLVLVGGRSTQCHSIDLVSYTNKTVVWNDCHGCWESSLPSMSVSRLCPITISHQGSLVVAGGKKGSLDYHVEVLHADADRWVVGPPLPLACLAHTSTIVTGDWYLMNQLNGAILKANLSSYIAAATGKLTRGHPTPDNSRQNGFTPLNPISHELSSSKASSQKHNGHVIPISTKFPSSGDTPPSGLLWNPLPCRPPELPFKITSTGSQLLALSNQHSATITAHVYHHGQTWTQVEGRFPSTLSSGLLLGGQRDQNVLYILGGQISHHYTNTAYKVTLTTLKKLSIIKKSRQLRLLSD